MIYFYIGLWTISTALRSEFIAVLIIIYQINEDQDYYKFEPNFYKLKTKYKLWRE